LGTENLLNPFVPTPARRSLGEAWGARRSCVATKTGVSRDTPTASTWRVHQTVTHKTFGIGIVQAVEEKSDKTILTVRFQTGIKRIASTFVK
jgi:hypothetical protein